MNPDQPEEQRPLDVVLVNAVRARQRDELEFKGLDLMGYGALGEILQEIPQEEHATAFAVAASMLSTRSGVYYSHSQNAISTDATFGNMPSLQPVFNVTGALRVTGLEAIWRFGGSGTLVLTLEEGPVVHLEVNDATALIGWLHMIDLEVLTFDGDKLMTAEPRRWPPGSLG